MKQNTTYPNDWGVLHLIAMAAWWKTARAQTVLQLRRRLEKLHCSNKLCPNCKGNHSELYKECPHCKKQSQIIKINTTFNISYAEACKKFKKYCNICDSWFDLSSGISPLVGASGGNLSGRRFVPEANQPGFPLNIFYAVFQFYRKL